MAEKDVSFLSVCKSLLLPEQLVLCNRLACRVLVLDTNSSSDFAEFGVWRVEAFHAEVNTTNRSCS